MGAWGTAIFSDDFASDIRAEYSLLLSLGRTDEEIFELVYNYYYNQCKDTEEEPVFWFAVALYQWNTGRLTENVKQKALEFIENGYDLSRWNSPENQKNYKKRKDELEKLKQKLVSPQPTRKKVPKPTITHSPWKVGDLLAYRLLNENTKESGHYGKYVLIRILEITRQEMSRIVPNAYVDESVIIGLYGWIGSEVPDVKIAEELDYIPFCDYTDPVLGRCRETTGVLSWQINELKKREIILVGNDISYREKLPEFFEISKNRYTLYGFHNLDFRITLALEEYFKS